jgi:2-succinyl-5-enolpyruvyl-6-hydroxy-3-cyclohexene-1-carboxylate synthase
VTGDLAFFYDSNALWNNYIPSNFKIIVVNNGGGGIFRILPGAKNTEHFTTYFETRHQLTAKHICAMFGFNYHTANNEKEVKETLAQFFEDSGTPKLLEIFTPSEMNDRVLQDYFKYIS